MSPVVTPVKLKINAFKDAMTSNDIAISIRRPSVADARMIKDLAVRTFHDAFWETNSPENMESYMDQAFALDKLQEEMADPQATFLVAEVEGEAVGYAKIYAGSPPECVRHRPAQEIVRLYVDRRFHGSGVARALMDACLDEAARAGCRGVFLGVWELNPRAQAFYRKYGFEIVGDHVFQMGDEAQTDFWMERPL
jgi:diamine N-acetyltransferase